MHTCTRAHTHALERTRTHTHAHTHPATRTVKGTDVIINQLTRLCILLFFLFCAALHRCIEKLAEAPLGFEWEDHDAVENEKTRKQACVVCACVRACVRA